MRRPAVLPARRAQLEGGYLAAACGGLAGGMAGGALGWAVLPTPPSEGELFLDVGNILAGLLLAAVVVGALGTLGCVAGTAAALLLTGHRRAWTTAAVTGGLAIALLLLAIEVGLPLPPLPVVAALLPLAARAAVVAVARQRPRSPAS